MYALRIIYSAHVSVLEIDIDVLRIIQKDKVYMAPISKIKIATREHLENAEVKSNKNRRREIWLTNGDWTVEISHFKNDKVFQKFYTYIYYRLKPGEYLDSVAQM